MNQAEFYNTPEVKLSIEIQKRNPYGSKEHKEAYKSILSAAKKYGVLKEYIESGGGCGYDLDIQIKMEALRSEPDESDEAAYAKGYKSAGPNGP